MMSQQFKPVDSVVWDVQSGKMGILTKDDAIAIFVPDESSDLLEGSEKNTLVGGIVLNPFSMMKMAIPAYACKTKPADIKLGDITLGANGNVSGWVTGIRKNNRFTVLGLDGTERSINPPTVNVIGFGDQSGLMIVKPLADITNGNTDGFKNMMLPLMMMGGFDESESYEGSSTDKMMQMMLMQSMMGTSNNGDSNNMMQMMLMMKMMGKDNSF